jgi:hypothetical protein
MESCSVILYIILIVLVSEDILRRQIQISGLTQRVTRCHKFLSW